MSDDPTQPPPVGGEPIIVIDDTPWVPKGKDGGSIPMMVPMDFNDRAESRPFTIDGPGVPSEDETHR